jgi:Flp pilus assembly protein TadB
MRSKGKKSNKLSFLLLILIIVIIILVALFIVAKVAFWIALVIVLIFGALWLYKDMTKKPVTAEEEAKSLW